jgi:hypothetical protein
VKRCTRCGLPKPAEDFGLDRRNPDGRQSRCRECKRAHDREAAKTPAGRARIEAALRRYRSTPAGRAAIRDRERDYRQRGGRAERRQRLRQQVFGHYGRSCACCGTAENPTIDHVNGDGSQHREELFGNGKQAGIRFYRWLVNNGFPEGYQTLCMPCNQSKSEGERCRLDHTILVT